jgi:glucan phosphoethanolaminetransferase (alkaline phosphatase superfamily)
MRNISAKNMGLITAAVMVIVSLIMFYKFNFSDKGATKIISYSIFTVGIVATLLIFKLNNAAEKTFKEYFSEGFKMFVVVVLIMAVFTYVFYKLNPQIFENTLVEINKYNVKDIDKTALDLEENNKQLRRAFMPMTIATNIIMYLIIGTLVTVCTGGFLSQKK